MSVLLRLGLPSPQVIASAVSGPNKREDAAPLCGAIMNGLTRDIFAERSLRRLFAVLRWARLRAAGCGPRRGSLSTFHFGLRPSSSSLGKTRASTILPSLLRRFNFQLFWAPGDAEIYIQTTAHWTANGRNSTDPATASLPLKNTPELTAKTQILPAAGIRDQLGEIFIQGTDGFFNLSTPYSATIGYDSSFYSTTYVSVRVWGTSECGFSIRCVRH